MALLHLAVLVPFLFAIVIPVLYKLFPRVHTGWFVLIIPLLLFIYLLSFIPEILQGSPIIHSVAWIPTLDIHFTVVIDGLNLLFSLIISGMGFLVILYSIYYMSKEREALHNFYVYLMLFMGAMLGLVMSDNLMVFYLFWELTSISSFLLIGYWYQRTRSGYGAQKAMLITMSGGFAMLAGFLILYLMTGSFSVREIIEMSSQLSEHVLFIPAMLLILAGAFTKSAQFPFHIWLPDAMEAPTPISAYLHSATMVKAGIYLVAWFTPIFGGNMIWLWIITGVGLMTLFWGSFMAIRQMDLKALLAFSTISQLGLIMSLLGVGSAALNSGFSDQQSILFASAILAAMFHLVNHSAFKGCLFMIIGILDHETGTRDVRKLGGLMSLMPISFTLTVIGAFSMAGLPPFSGFLSKEMFFTGMLNISRSMDAWAALLPFIAWIASILTFVYSMIVIFKTFLGSYHPERLDKEPHEAPFGMLISPIILASFAIILFIFPNLLSPSILEPTVNSILPNMLSTGEQFDVHIKRWHGWNLELLMTLGVVVLGILLYLRLKRWSGIYDVLPSKFTLNNAYNAGLEGLQRYSGKWTNFHMTGSLRDYMVYIFSFIIVLLGGSMIYHNAFALDIHHNAPIELYELVLAVILVVAASVVLLSKSRIVSIIAIGATGFIVSLFFVIFRAPDLALTQLVVETITTALFLLCFYYLPELKKEISPVRFRLTNLLISLGVGATVTCIGLAASGHRLFTPISEYFLDSYELAGANNIVNAILVDFRAFDTMLEILVLFMVGLGVYTLIKFRQTKEDRR